MILATLRDRPPPEPPREKLTFQDDDEDTPCDQADRDWATRRVMGDYVGDLIGHAKECPQEMNFCHALPSEFWPLVTNDRDRRRNL